MTSPTSSRARILARRLSLLLLAGGALSGCLPSAPAIENVSPFKGQGGVAGDAPVSVTFDRAMDRSSVEDRFEVKPAVEGCDRTACPISWNGATFSMSHPGHPFSDDTKYRVFIHPGYKDAGGQVNSVEHVWEFQTELPPTLRSASPAAGSTGVATDGDIVLQFSRPIQALAPAQLTLRPTASVTDPNVDYHLALGASDQSQVTISPLRPLRPNTTYRLSLTADIQDVHHNTLGRRTDVEFTTGPLSLGRSLGFAVLDSNSHLTRIAQLRPPASLNTPAPSVRVLYQAANPIRSWGWSFDATHLYTLEGTDGTVMSVSLATGEAARLPITASSIAISPGADEVAYAAADRSLHIWSASSGDIVVPQAGSVVVGGLSWSGDGRRLAAVTEVGGKSALSIVDRGTLSRYLVPDVDVAPGPMSWTFDGANLAFVRNVGPGTPAEVWIYHALATDATLQRVDSLPAVGTLAWASDGNSLYAAISPEAVGQSAGALQRAPAHPVAGQATGFTAIRNTQAGDGDLQTPSFDRRLAFVRPVDRQPQLWLINNDGSGLTELTFAGYDPIDQLITYGVGMPEWAPATTGG